MEALQGGVVWAFGLFVILPLILVALVRGGQTAESAIRTGGALLDAATRPNVKPIPETAPPPVEAGSRVDWQHTDAIGEIHDRGRDKRADQQLVKTKSPAPFPGPYDIELDPEPPVQKKYEQPPMVFEEGGITYSKGKKLPPIDYG